MDTTSTLAAVRGWPVQDQLELVFGLWDQITEAGWRPTPCPELLAELERRLTAHEADPARTLTWEQVLAHVKRAR